jgi:hypothetical protein
MKLGPTTILNPPAEDESPRDITTREGSVAPRDGSEDGRDGAVARDGDSGQSGTADTATPEPPQWWQVLESEPIVARDPFGLCTAAAAAARAENEDPAAGMPSPLGAAWTVSSRTWMFSSAGEEETRYWRDVGRVLRLRGTDPTVPDWSGRTALHVAAAEGGVATVRIILERIVSYAGAQGDTVVGHAAVLVAAQKRDIYGNTPRSEARALTDPVKRVAILALLWAD